MLTDKDLGIKKFILDRIMQINDEIVESDPEYKKLEERPNELLRLMAAELTPEDKERLMKEYDNTYYAPIYRSRRANLQRGVDGWDIVRT